MCIKLIKEYSTDIHDILELANQENAFFISDWDKNPYILNFDAEIIQKSLDHQEHINTYIMSKDMNDIKKSISSYFDNQGVRISPNQLTIVTNGTSAAFISILQTIKQGAQNFLCNGPKYFTYLHILKIFDRKLFHYDINLFDEIKFDFITLEKKILEKHIHSIILIQPFFGSGVNMTDNDLHEFIMFCEKNKIYLFVDNIYGNMDWHSSTHIHTTKLTQLVVNTKYCILYESISKRIFVNGIKNSVIFASSTHITNINIDSEICLGGVSYIQEALMQEIYLQKNIEKVNNFISNTLDYVANNYALLCTLILGTGFQVSKTICGYFTLFGIPKSIFSASTDKDIARELFEKTHIVTIPHSRYYFYLPDYYCFRINLAVEIYELVKAIEKILNL